MSELTDDQTIARMRSALDELTADVENDGADVVSLHAVVRHPGRGRAWLGATAATVLLAGAAVFALSARSEDPVAGPDTVPATAPATASDSSAPVVTSEPRSDAPTYTITSARLAPGASAVESAPPDPSLLQVWRIDDGALDGFLTVSVQTASPFGVQTGWTSTELTGFGDGTARLMVPPAPAPDIPADPIVEWRRTDGGVWIFEESGLSDAGDAGDWLDVVRSAVPGSGVPVVLTDARAEFIGTSGSSTTVARQEFTGVDGGTVALALTDSLMLFKGLPGVTDVSPISVAGRDGWRVALDGELVMALWDAGDGWYGLISVPYPLSEHADDIIAAVVRTDTAPPAETVPAPATEQPTEPLYRTTANLIQAGDGPAMIAYGFRSSSPPQGGVVELAGLDWLDVPDARTQGGTTWTEALYELIGTFDGTVFTLTERPRQATVNEPMPTPTTIPTVACADADADATTDATNAIAEAGLGVISTANRSDGGCGVLVRAVFDTPELRAALAPLGDQVRVEFAITPL